MLGVVTAVAWLIVAMGATMFKGAPEVQVKMPPRDHRSTIRCTQAGPPARKGLFAPNGNSNVPSVVNACFRSNPNRSEERRVGKECGFAWRQEAYEQKHAIFLRRGRGVDE